MSHSKPAITVQPFHIKYFYPRTFPSTTVASALANHASAPLAPLSTLVVARRCRLRPITLLLRTWIQVHETAVSKSTSHDKTMSDDCVRVWLCARPGLTNLSNGSMVQFFESMRERERSDSIRRWWSDFSSDFDKSRVSQNLHISKLSWLVLRLAFVK